MNIKKELSQNSVCLLVMSGQKYNELSAKIAKDIASKNTCYITLNKTYASLKETFQKKKVSLGKVIFIDAISKTFKKSPEQTDHCYFISSPGALTELSITIKKFLKHDFDYLIFDSITNLTIYQSKNTVIKFLSDLINNIKASNTKAVFYALDIKEQESLIKQAGTFADKVIKLGKSE